MLDDLRDIDDFEDDFEDDESLSEGDFSDEGASNRGFLGLSPAERMIVAFLLLIVVIVFGVLILLLMGVIQL